MSVARGPFPPIPFSEAVVVDTETTGLAPGDGSDGHRICSASFLRIARLDGTWRRTATMSFLCNPGRPVPEYAAKVNGFHWSGDGSNSPEGRLDLAGEHGFGAYAEQILAFIGRLPLIFHNANFDAAFIDYELSRAGARTVDVQTYCTKKAFADLRGLGRPDHYIANTNLNALADLLGVSRIGRQTPSGSELHGSEADAAITADCFGHLEAMGWMLGEDAAALPHRRPGFVRAA
jgi:DNA polymerase-3 subunit epsilon